jgi:hypothetical protein
MADRKTKIIGALLAMLPLAALGSGDEQNLIIVSTSALIHYWAVDEPWMQENFEDVEVNGMDEDAAGCVNIGFIIEQDGKTKAQRTLKASLDARALRRKETPLIGFTAFAPYMRHDTVVGILHYKASAENLEKSAVFTSFPFVYMSSKIAARLSESQKKKFFDDLRLSCTIDDLPSWIKEHGAQKAVIVPAPIPPSADSGS